MAGKIQLLSGADKSERGQAMVEYALMLFLLVLIVIASFTGVANATTDIYYNRIIEAINNVFGGP